MQKALVDLVQSLEEGKPFSEGAEKHSHVFPALFINMMRAGEAGGNMDEILERMATYFEKQYQTVQKVKSAMMYPATVGVITVIIVIFLLSTVVPTFADMFASFGGELPLITRIVLGMGDFMQHVWWLFVLSLLVFMPVLFMSAQSQDEILFRLCVIKNSCFRKITFEIANG